MAEKDQITDISVIFWGEIIFKKKQFVNWYRYLREFCVAKFAHFLSYPFWGHTT